MYTPVYSTYSIESINICRPKRERGLPEDGCSYEATERGMEGGEGGPSPAPEG